MGKAVCSRKVGRARGKLQKAAAAAEGQSSSKRTDNAFHVLETLMSPAPSPQPSAPLERPSSISPERSPPPLDQSFSSQQSPTPTPSPEPSTPPAALIPEPQLPLINLREDEWWDEDEQFYPGYSGQRKVVEHVLVDSPPPNPRTLHILGSVGVGAYGKVFAAQDTNTGLLNCVKVFDKNRIARLNGVMGVKRELETNKRLLEHRMSPFLLEASASFERDQYLFMVMPLMARDLQTMVGQHIPDAYLSKYILQTALGIDALHSMGIIHCDIKPANILLDAFGNVRLADFGLSYIHSTAPLSRHGPSVMIRSPLGTPEFLGPEAMLPGGWYNQMIDYWALGVTFFMMLTGQYPFPTVKELRDYCEDPLVNTPPFWMHRHGLSFPAADVVSKLLEADPAKRWACDDLGYCMYFEGVACKSPDWKARFEAIAASQYPYGSPQHARYGNTNFAYDSLSDLREARIMKPCWDIEDTKLLGDFYWINPRGPWAKSIEATVNSPWSSSRTTEAIASGAET
ncbi:kinase-like protein [Dentipellis sp. KUC8613]|nr:kinase-like protein [Dentipellis sp. KUC8613]